MMIERNNVVLCVTVVHGWYGTSIWYVNYFVLYNVNVFILYVFELVYDKLYYALTSQRTQPPLQKVPKEKTLHLSEQFPVIANVYCVNITRKEMQTFLKCKCLLYERFGILCSHILKIRNGIEVPMIKVQHWKVYPVYVGGENEMLSEELMELLSIQSSNENMGVPICDGILQECQRILDDRYVTLICSFWICSIWQRPIWKPSN